MIIPQENISTYISKKDELNSTYKLHTPSNVFFEMVKKEITYEFVGFRVARFDSATNMVVDEQKFNGTRDTSFFKAVDYFEELIEKNSPKKEEDDFDSVGYFVYFRAVQEYQKRIPIEKVVLNYAEASYPDKTPIEFKDFLEASKYIADNIELTSVGYDKHGITATWADGTSWEEQFSISEKENNPKKYKNIFGTSFLRSAIFKVALGERGISSVFNKTAEETIEIGKEQFEELKKYDFQIQPMDILETLDDLAKGFGDDGWITNSYKIKPYTEDEFRATFKKYSQQEKGFLDPYIDINNEIVTIPYQDVDKVFTPPQTKKYGRLDMTVLDDPKYDVVRSKFALKYNEEKSKEIANSKGLNLADVWAYEMQPYSNGTPEEDGEGEGTPPPDVNDNQLNANDIEGEEPQQREPKKGEKSEKSDKGEKGEKGENSEGEDEDLGWDEDEKGKPTDEQGKPTDEKGEPTDEKGKPTDEQGKPTDENGNPPPNNGRGEPSGEGEPSDEEAGRPVGVYNMDLIESLNRKFQTDDILSAYKTPKTFMSALRLKGEQIREFAPLVGLENTATKGEILREIEQQITPFYQ